MYDTVDIPAELADKAAEYREALLDTVSNVSDEVMELALEGEDIPEELLIAAIRKGTLDSSFTPIFCGSAFKNKGVQPLLDAVVKYLPSPLDIEGIEGTKPGNDEEKIVRQASDDEPLAALAFKIMSDPHLGKLTFVRVYLGALRPAPPSSTR